MVKKTAKPKAPPNPEGRPPHFRTPEEMQAKIEEYFKSGHETRSVTVKVGKDEWSEQKVPVCTVTGLALFLGFCDRHSFYDYEKRPLFSHTVKRARAFIERTYEGLLHSGNCTGAIFALKNFGWTDKSEVEQTIKVTQMPTIKLTNGKDLELDVGEDPDAD